MSSSQRFAVVGVLLAITTISIVAARQAQFTAESELVVLRVRVTDKSGAYVSGLTADAFRIFEEGRPQTLHFFEYEDTPVTIGLIIDSSGSMRNARDRIIAASAGFVESSNPHDEVFALVFNDDVRPVLTESAPFTSNAGALRDALDNAFVPAGRTSLYDAIVEALAYGARGTLSRKALVVLSDGGDNASHTAFSDAMAQVQASDVIIYTVVLEDPADHESNPKKLRQFAESSGGNAFAPQDVASVHRVFQQISRDIRHSYTIGYEPGESQPRTGFRKVRVEVRAPDGGKLAARTRTGYPVRQTGTGNHGE